MLMLCNTLLPMSAYLQSNMIYAAISGIHYFSRLVPSLPLFRIGPHLDSPQGCILEQVEKVSTCESNLKSFFVLLQHSE